MKMAEPCCVAKLGGALGVAVLAFKSCHDQLMEGIARGRSKPLMRDRHRTRT